MPPTRPAGVGKTNLLDELEHSMRRLQSGLTLIETLLTPLLCLSVLLALLLVNGGGPEGPVFVLTLLCASIPIVAISWSFDALQRSIVSATTQDPESLQKIATVPTDLDAALIVRELSKSGIRAIAVRGDALGLQPSMPAQINVVVTRQDLERAEAMLSHESPDAA
jgi:hypothetical protein